MLHPSYTDLMKVVNSEVEKGEQPIVNSRYSIVLATAKRARQLIDGAEPLVVPKCNKYLSIAIDELYQGKVKILCEDEETYREYEKEYEKEYEEAEYPDVNYENYEQ